MFNRRMSGYNSKNPKNKSIIALVDEKYVLLKGHSYEVKLHKDTFHGNLVGVDIANQVCEIAHPVTKKIVLVNLDNIVLQDHPKVVGREISHLAGACSSIINMNTFQDSQYFVMGFDVPLYISDFNLASRTFKILGFDKNYSISDLIGRKSDVDLSKMGFEVKVNSKYNLRPSYLKKFGMNNYTDEDTFVEVIEYYENETYVVLKIPEFERSQAVPVNALKMPCNYAHNINKEIEKEWSKKQEEWLNALNHTGKTITSENVVGETVETETKEMKQGELEMMTLTNEKMRFAAASIMAGFDYIRVKGTKKTVVLKIPRKMIKRIGEGSVLTTDDNQNIEVLSFAPISKNEMNDIVMRENNGLYRFVVDAKTKNQVNKQNEQEERKHKKARISINNKIQKAYKKYDANVTKTGSRVSTDWLKEESGYNNSLVKRWMKRAAIALPLAGVGLTSANYVQTHGFPDLNLDVMEYIPNVDISFGQKTS